MRMVVLLLLLLVIEITCSTAQANQVECFTDGNCYSPPTITSTRRECCVGISNALTFIIEGDDTCHVCIGEPQTIMISDTLVAPERGPSYSVQAGYLKGANEAQENLEFNVQTEQGTATLSDRDFTLYTPNFQVLFRNSEPEEVSFGFNVDAVAQELPETVVLRLEPTNLRVLEVFDFDNNAFFFDQLNLTIIDSDRVEIFFTNNDYRVSEPDLFVPVRVAKISHIATPVTVEVIPLTLTQFRNTTGRPDPPGLAVDSRLSPIEANLEDFNNSVNIVTFPSDEGVQLITDLPAFVPIVDDSINEAYEQDFIVTLQVTSATNKFSIDIYRQKDTICRIIDDDGIRIGFELPSYTFDEPEVEEIIFNEVFLATENGVQSEQTFHVVVTASSNTPNTNIQPARISEGELIDNDYEIHYRGIQTTLIQFVPGDRRVPLNFRLFSDNVAEGTEAFQVLCSGPLENTPYFMEPQINPQRQSLYHNTFIVIEDDDFVVIGFERNYEVDESVGAFEICVNVTNPPPEEKLPFTVVLLINTILGTAGEQDYTPLSALNLDVALIFSDGTRRDCFDVTIIDDDVFENTETFTIDLVFDIFSPAPSAVILDPNVTSITILDDDELSIGFINPPFEVGENGGFFMISVGVLSSGALEREVVISLSTSDGTATDQSDFIGTSDFLITFGPSQTSLSVPVNIISDGVYEFTEYFSAKIVSLEGSIERLTIAPVEVNITIIDDDAVVVGFEREQYTVRESEGSIEVCAVVTSVHPLSFPVILSVNTVPGTADEQDFVELAAMRRNVVLFFTNADRKTCIDVVIIDDALVESSEVFTVNLVFHPFFAGAGIFLRPNVTSITIEAGI